MTRLPVRILLPSAGEWRLRIQTPYSAEFVAAIKLLPRHARSYDPDRKCWLVDHLYLDEVKQICERFFDEVEVTDVAKPKPPPPKGTRYLGVDGDCEHDWVKPWRAAVVERCKKCSGWKVPPLKVASKE